MSAKFKQGDIVRPRLNPDIELMILTVIATPENVYEYRVRTLDMRCLIVKEFELDYWED